MFSGIFTNDGHQNTERVKEIALFLTRSPIYVKQMAFSLTCLFFRKIEHAQFLASTICSKFSSTHSGHSLELAFEESAAQA